MDPSDAGSAGIFSRWTINQTQEARVYSHDGPPAPSTLFSRWTNQTQKAWVYSRDGPIRRRKHGYILTMDQSDAGSAGVLSRWTNQTQEARVYSNDGPIRRRKRGYILMTDQSDAGSAGLFS
eukprot:923878-Prorocentrum_minimum.AAC.1